MSQKPAIPSQSETINVKNCSDEVLNARCKELGLPVVSRNEIQNPATSFMNGKNQSKVKPIPVIYREPLRENTQWLQYDFR